MVPGWGEPILSLASVCCFRRGASWLHAKVPGNPRAFKQNWPPHRSPLRGCKASASENGFSEVSVQGWDCGYRLCSGQEDSGSLKLVFAEGLLAWSLP